MASIQMMKDWPWALPYWWHSQHPAMSVGMTREKGVLTEARWASMMAARRVTRSGVQCSRSTVTSPFRKAATTVGTSLRKVRRKATISNRESRDRTSRKAWARSVSANMLSDMSCPARSPVSRDLWPSCACMWQLSEVGLALLVDMTACLDMR